MRSVTHVVFFFLLLLRGGAAASAGSFPVCRVEEPTAQQKTEQLQQRHQGPLTAAQLIGMDGQLLWPQAVALCFPNGSS